MAHSYAENPTLNCPHCGHSFAAEIWLIVDAAERPDLLARIQTETLHSLPCPHCGQGNEPDVPLLLYQPEADSPLIFSPAQETSPEEDQAHTAGLLGLLQTQLGNA